MPMRRKHHLRLKRMGQTPSLTGLELSILLYLHGDFERSDEEIMAECRGIEQESIRHAVRGLAGQEFIIRTKEEEFLLRPDCWLCRTAGAQAMGGRYRSGSSIIPGKSYRMRHGHEHERPPHCSGGARTAVSGGADCRRYPVGSGGRSSVPASRAVDPGRHRLLLQVTLTGKEENET